METLLLLCNSIDTIHTSWYYYYYYIDTIAQQDSTITILCNCIEQYTTASTITITR